MQTTTILNVLFYSSLFLIIAFFTLFLIFVKVVFIAAFAVSFITFFVTACKS
jgi:hypothetical protein